MYDLAGQSGSLGHSLHFQAIPTFEQSRAKKKLKMEENLSKM